MQKDFTLPSECGSSLTSVNTYEIDGKMYRVVSHYTGTKDIDKVLESMALRRAYADMKSAD